MRTSIVCAVMLLSGTLLEACSNSNSSDNSQATGGQVTSASGGATGTSTSSHTGGSTSASQSTTTGGDTGVGGTMMNGGASNTGGSMDTGGTSASTTTTTGTGGIMTGGASAVGGVTASGGKTSSGGSGTTVESADAGPLTDTQLRGKYLVTGVLGCTGCHTPQGGAQLSGTDCFVKNGATCLSSANLTNDETGIKNLTDQQVKDAFTKGKDPDEAGSYLFAQMPYYQFANLSDEDANAIVAFLRTVPGVSHQVQANTAPYDVQPTAPEWAPVDPTALPAAGAAAGADNGKYLATLACVTCHTVEKSGAQPKMIDALKAFQGGKVVTATVSGASKSVQTSNLTPDATGIQGWTAAQIATAITTDKNTTGTTICGMRALANMTQSDATDIGTYLLGIPAVVNSITQTCQ